MSVAAARERSASFAVRSLSAHRRGPTNLDRWMATKSYMLVTVQGLKGEERYLIAEASSDDEKEVLLPLSFDCLEDALKAKAALEGQRDDAPAAEGDTGQVSRKP